MPPGFRPASYLENPALFGREEELAWRSVDEELLGELAAARLQHQFVFELRRRWGDDTAERVAEALNRPDRLDYLRRKVNGQIPLTLVELLEWADLFDVPVRVGD